METRSFRKQRLSRKDDNCMLRLVSGVSAEGGIDVEAHVKGALEACLYPCGFVCRAAGGGCHENALMSRGEFEKHGHDKKTGAVEVKEEAKATTAKRSRVREWNVVKESTPHGHSNLVSLQNVGHCVQGRTR